MNYPKFAAAALAEIAGCFAFWAWWWLDKSPLCWRRAASDFLVLFSSAFAVMLST